MGGLLAAWVSGSACSTTTGLGNRTPTATAILVDPSDFLGNRTCQTGEGAVESYQATLYDVSSGLDGATLVARAPLVSCKSSAYFESVTAGHFYIAHISAYTEAGLLVESVDGAPRIVTADGEPATASLSTFCLGNEGISVPYTSAEVAAGLGGFGGSLDAGLGGSAGGPGLGVQAEKNTRVRVRQCLPWQALAELGKTGLIVRLEPSLGNLRCGIDEGEIAGFRVSLLPEIPAEDPPLTSLGGASLGGSSAMGGEAGSLGMGGSPEEPSLGLTACDESLRVEGLAPDRLYEFTLEAYLVGAKAPTHVASCLGRTSLGVMSVASCTQLVAVAE